MGLGTPERASRQTDNQQLLVVDYLFAVCEGRRVRSVFSASLWLLPSAATTFTQKKVNKHE